MLIFAHGPDVPGIGKAITKVLYKENCNIENFKIVTLDGFFTLMVSISSDEYLDQSELQGTINEAVAEFEIVIKVIKYQLPAKCLKRQKEEWIPYEIKFICERQTETLFYFMKIMSEYEVNVSDVRCCRIGEDTSKNFQIITHVELPIHVSYEIFKASLDEISLKLSCLVDINPVSSLEI